MQLVAPRSLIGFGVATLIAIASSAGAQSLEGPATIVDGDGLWVAGAEIRLHGIDAPEGRQTYKRGYQVYRCGDSATQALHHFVNGRQVTCGATDRDRYGRTVARRYAQGIDLGTALVEAGWALAYRRYSKDCVSQEDAVRSSGNCHRMMHRTGAPECVQALRQLIRNEVLSAAKQAPTCSASGEVKMRLRLPALQDKASSGLRCGYSGFLRRC